MEDIAPALYNKIKADFDARVSNDTQIQRILKRIEEGTATARDTQYYAIRIGKHAADAFKENISSEVLPDGKMYYNIAERTVVPQLMENYEMVEGVAEAVQQQLNAEAGIGLNPVHVDVNQSRIDGIINRITAADVYDTVAWMLVEPVRNFTQSVADDFVRENVAFQSKAGLSPKITREVYGNCCAWCAALAGTYEYKKEPKDFYRKHEYCRCLIIYDPGKGKVQNSHTKEWFQSERDARIDHIESLSQNEIPSFDKRGAFGTKADPMSEAFGPGALSHPEEIKSFREECRKMGVDIIERDHEVMSYEPSAIVGKPGQLVMHPKASYSAWCHEMQHVYQDRDSGWDGAVKVWDMDEHFRREKTAYDIEISLAEAAGRNDIADRLRKNFEEERKKIYGQI